MIGMSETLHVRLIGRSTITIGASPLHFRAQRAVVLIAYLAVTRQAFSRETVATWLWDDRTQKQSMANMRRLLARMPAEIKPYLRVDNQAVGLDFDRPISVDLWAWETAIAERDIATLQTLSKQFQPKLLDGVLIRDSWGVDEWIIAQQARWQQTTLAAFRQLSQHALHHRQIEDGIRYARQLVAIDSLLESSHRLLMRLYVRGGQRTLALRQFEQCRDVLQAEFGIMPDAETIALVERIRHANATPPHVVPVPNGAFIGRKTLRAYLQAQLDKSDCRLLTLTGMGGVGKTRLAIQIADERKGDYLNGIYFTSLTAASTQASIVDALIDALNFVASSNRPRKRQLLEHLQDREMLLILDNFEQIIDAGMPLIQEILERCPRLQLLVTSRERLHLGAEWRVAVGGITRREDAVALFLLHAQKQDRQWSQVDDDEVEIWEICQLIEGLPLGIELAAGALAYHSLGQISAEIRNNVNFLQSNQRDRESRHRTAYAIFRYSWELLSPEEQATFAQCACFRGGFSADAARAVINAHPAILHALVDKSLLQISASGRYHLHELLRQFAAGKVADRAAVAEKMGGYFLRFLREQYAAGWLGGISAEWDNIQAAWRWAIQHQRWDAHNDAIDALNQYCYRQNRFQIGLELFTAAVAATTDKQTRPRLLIRQANFFVLMAQYDDAIAALQEAEQLLFHADAPVETAIYYQILGHIAAAKSDYVAARSAFQTSLAHCADVTSAHNPTYVRLLLVKPLYYLGDHAEALNLAQQVVAEFQAQGDDFYLARAQTRLADIMDKQGDWQGAEALLNQTLEQQRVLGDEVGMGKTYGLLADKAVWKDDFERGIYYTEQSLAIHYRIGAPLSIAIQLGNLGTYYHELKQYDKAQSLYAESLRRSEQIGDRMGMVFTIQNMAELCEWQGEVAQAVTFWERALPIALDIQAEDRILHAIAGIAQTKILPQSPQRAYDLLHFVRHHPASVPETHRYLADSLSALQHDAASPLTLEQAIAYCQHS